MTQVDDAKKKMENTINVFQNALNQIRTSGANPKLLENVQIDYYGMETPINQVASISVVEGKQLLIKPYESSIVKDIEKAIFKADIGLTPQNEGTQLRINVPPLTEDRRKQFTKDVSKFAEEAKVACRNARRDANDSVKKDKTLPEDTVKDLQDQIQKATDKAIAKIDEITKAKNAEIMKV